MLITRISIDSCHAPTASQAWFDTGCEKAVSNSVSGEHHTFDLTWKE